MATRDARFALDARVGLVSAAPRGRAESWSIVKLARLAALPLLALAFAASGGPQTAPPAVGSFALAINPASLTVTQGSSVSVTVTLDRQNGFADAVAVSLANPLEGVFGQAVTIPAGAVSATLGVSAEDSVAVGALTLKFSGVAGSLTQNVNLGLTVTPASNPDFYLSLTPGSLALAQGSVGTVTVKVTRLNGLPDLVALQLSGAPQGVSASALSVPAGADSATLTIATDASAALAASQLSVNGATATLSHSAPLSLTVLNASAPDFNLVLSPATLSLVTGSTAEVNLSLTRVNGFSGDVTLSLTNPPAGISAPDATIAAGSSAAKLALSVSSAAASGNATLSFTAIGAGLTNLYPAAQCQCTDPAGHDRADDHQPIAGRGHDRRVAGH